MAVQRVAAEGFDRGAGDYERGRPGYPQEVVDLLAAELGIGRGRRVLDLAAGTGKLTRMLPATGAEILAVEPVAGMRAELHRLLPDIEVLDGTAEQLPLPDDAVDVVTVAQSFHWFDAPAALAEIHRVLRDGGGLAMIWNVRDGRVPWVAELSEIIHWHRHDVSAYEERIDWAGIVAASGAFEPLEKRQLFHEQPHDLDTLLARVASVSYIAVMAKAERDAVLDRVRDLVQDFPPTFVMPYRTDVYWCLAR